MKKLIHCKVIIIPRKGDWLTRYGDNKKSDEYYGDLDANELIKEIKRHCDSVKSYEIERYYECEFCNGEWEEVYDAELKRIMPACCDRALEEEKTKEAA